MVFCGFFIKSFLPCIQQVVTGKWNIQLSLQDLLVEDFYMLPEKKVENNSDGLGVLNLPICHSSKNDKPISGNPDFTVTSKRKNIQYWTSSIGGSYNQIQDVFIDPFTTEDNDETNPSKKYENRKKRGSVTVFSKRSRSRLNTITSTINKDKVHPSEVLFMTLTSPSVGWYELTGKEWKKRLNHFNTRLRQKFKNHPTFCGIWRMEFQRRGSPHFHYITYGVSFIEHSWISQTWNNICSKGLSEKEREKHLCSGTNVQRSRSWNNIHDYFSKTMSYVSKDEGYKLKYEVEQGRLPEEVLEWTKTFGNHWGVINKDNLDYLRDTLKGEFDDKVQYFKVRRTTRKLIQSSIKRKMGDNYNHKVGKSLHKVYSQRLGCKNNFFLDHKDFMRLLCLYGWSGEIIDDVMSGDIPDEVIQDNVTVVG